MEPPRQVAVYHIRRSGENEQRQASLAAPRSQFNQYEWEQRQAEKREDVRNVAQRKLAYQFLHRAVFKLVETNDLIERGIGHDLRHQSRVHGVAGSLGDHVP